MRLFGARQRAAMPLSGGSTRMARLLAPASGRTSPPPREQSGDSLILAG